MSESKRWLVVSGALALGVSAAALTGGLAGQAQSVGPGVTVNPAAASASAIPGQDAMATILATADDAVGQGMTSADPADSSANTANSPVSANTPASPNSPVSANTPASPNSPVSANTPASPNSPASANTPASPASPASAVSPASPVSAASPASPASPASAD
ncbi:MAG: hypothetical protein WCF36_01430 [Candidatus Nanopelagicales bacterium]